MKDNIRSIEARLADWHSFVEKRSGKFMFHVNFPLPDDEKRLPPMPPLWPGLEKERIARRWAEYQLMLKKAALVDDDRIPFISNITGTEIFAEAFGCEVHRPADNLPFAIPFVNGAAEADALEIPEISVSSLAPLFDIADELRRRGGPSAIMKPVDIQSPMDIVALIWDKSDLFCAMVESPDSVKALAKKVRNLLTAFLDEWFRRYGTTFVAHYPDYVMHGGITMSVDEVGAVSEDMFREFFTDELVAISRHFGGLGVHCCADARHQWGNFRALPGLKVINHNVPPTSDPREYVFDSLSFYAAQSLAQMPIGWQPQGEPETWPSQFPEEARVVFEVQAKDASSAAAIAERLRELRG